MKFNNTVSSKPSKTRKAHFKANTLERRILMSAPLCKELKDKYKVRSMPIRKNDKVLIVSGAHHDTEGKVTTVYRKKWCIFVDKMTRENKKGDLKSIGIKPSNCVITELHLDKDRKALLERKKRVEA
eukprot:Gregarina_sp_Poly_1__3109@NODE_1876_length_3153_cov_184_290992_g1217_i0_p4_GENE_NODE_1876_length_3153_cov_184_290992_g1217_i0NODE_1876_length_3153_cov_184_290992_g1217_i0_p4_ORF_typecomplete_len127_score27_01Ribosomal_L26/PF16906_5/3_9e40KOW/PF00467_29/5_8e06_NODE_1876_length_3153_cov_184_290992_g1217_i021932573